VAIVGAGELVVIGLVLLTLLVAAGAVGALVYMLFFNKKK
jgi:hypothetical protein